MSLLPVYREGFANPWSLFGNNPFNEMRQMMREVDELFPFHAPGQFRPGLEPSSLAPVNDGKNYTIQVQAQDFQPNEITVKTIKRHGRDFVVVEGKHETSDQDGYHSVQHFKRQYMIPENVEVEKFASKLSANGTLSIQAPVKPKQDALQAGDSRTIPIEHVKK